MSPGKVKVDSLEGSVVIVERMKSISILRLVLYISKERKPFTSNLRGLFRAALLAQAFPLKITLRKIKEWKNNLLVCGLSSTHITRLIIENNKVIGEESLLSDQGERFRDIAVGKDGALYTVTDSGKLYRIGM